MEERTKDSSSNPDIAPHWLHGLGKVVAPIKVSWAQAMEQRIPVPSPPSYWALDKILPQASTGSMYIMIFPS